MKRILVPCDFSPTATDAFRFASRIANKTNGDIHVLYIIDSAFLKNAAPGLSGHTTFNEVVMQRMESEMAEKFKQLTEDVPEAKNKATFKIETGSLTSTIEAYCLNHDVDLVIMGTHGASGLKELLIGSNTEKVVRHAPVPVVAVPPESFGESISSIVFPLAPDDISDSAVYEVKAIQTLFGAKLHLLWINTQHIFKSDADAIEDLQDFAVKYHLQNYEVHMRSDYSEHEGIQRFVKDVKAGLLFMPTHARKGIVHWFTGSITEKVVNHVGCPVWTMAMKN